MPTLQILLLLSSLQISYMTSTSSNSEPDTAESCKPILPLTLIHTETNYITPTKIENPQWTIDGRCLNARTKFTNTDPQGQQIFICAPFSQTQQTKDDSSEDPDVENCNYPITFKETDPLRCPHEPEYIIEKLFINDGSSMNIIPCGQNETGRMFQFVYKICTTEYPIENGKPIDIAAIMNTSIYREDFVAFQFCYDEEIGTVLQTLHITRSPHLLIDDALKNERNKSYKMMLDANNHFKLDLNAEKAQLRDYDQNHEIDDSSDQSKPEDSSATMILHKLVPSEDFAFASWKKPTYHFLNYNLMREDLVDLWDYISNAIRQDAIKKNREYLITTSANRTFDFIPSELHKPQIWEKQVFFRHNKLDDQDEMPKYKAIFIAMNQHFDDPLRFDPLRIICENNLCEDFFTSRFPKTANSIRCCSMVNDLSGAFGKIDQDLELDFLRGEEIKPPIDNSLE